MRLIFHGQLADLYGDTVEMASDTAAEAIEGFSRQAADWPRDLRISVVTSNDRLDDEDKLRTYHEEVHLVPSLTGGSGKFTNIILGAALIGISFIPGIGQAVATSLLVSGALMVAQGVLSMFMKAPKVNSVNDPDASKYLPVNKNTTDVGTPITMAWGRINLAGQWISLQSDSSNLSYGTFPANPT